MADTLMYIGSKLLNFGNKLTLLFFCYKTSRYLGILVLTLFVGRLSTTVIHWNKFGSHNPNSVFSSPKTLCQSTPTFTKTKRWNWNQYKSKFNIFVSFEVFLFRENFFLMRFLKKCVIFGSDASELTSRTVFCLVTNGRSWIY